MHSPVEMADLLQPVSGEVSAEERLSRRAKIAALQEFMLTEVPPDQHVEPEVIHHFAGGIYTREMRIPAGVLVVGKIHKHPHIAALVQGRVTITTEAGSETLDAPVTRATRPGIKRVAYAHTDAVWLSVHIVGEERDLEKIEAMVIAKDFDDPALTGEAAPQIEEQAA